MTTPLYKITSASNIEAGVLDPLVTPDDNNYFSAWVQPRDQYQAFEGVVLDSKKTLSAKFFGGIKSWLQRIGPHDNKGHTFIDLEAFSGLLSSALRAEKSKGYQVTLQSRYASLLELNGAQKLFEDLVSQQAPVVRSSLENDIYQTDDENRSIVELVSNGIDASDGDIHINLRDGFYEVMDTGIGLTPKIIITKLLVAKMSEKPNNTHPIGRFGIGFYTVLRHLQKEGESVEMITKSTEGSYRLLFIRQNGRIQFRSESIKIKKGDPLYNGGTLVRVKASSIQEKAMREEMDKYLRHVNHGRSLFVNQQKTNTLTYETLEAWPANSQGVPVKIVRSLKPGICVKVGEIIIESYATQGSVLDGELVIELPHEAAMSITRDQIAVDETVHRYFTKIAQDLQAVEGLNSLVPLYRALDQRHAFEPLLKILKEQMEKVIATHHDHQKIYPDREKIRSSLRETNSLVFVAPELFKDTWHDRLNTPDEFRSGTIQSAGGWQRPLQMRLSEETTQPLVLDAESGVLYLQKSFYEQAEAFVLSAMFMVPGMDFRVNWQQIFTQAGLSTVGAQIDEASHKSESSVDASTSKLPKIDVPSLVKYWQDQGYDLPDFIKVFKGQWKQGTFDLDETWFAVKSEGQTYICNEAGCLLTDQRFDHVSCQKVLNRLWVIVKREGKFNVLDQDGHFVLNQWYDFIDLREAGGKLWYHVSNNQKWQLLNQDQKPVFQSSYNYTHPVKAGGQIWFIVQKDRKWNVMTEQEEPVFDLWYDHVDVQEGLGHVYYIVKMGNKEMILNQDQEPVLNQWYDNCSLREVAGQVYYRVKKHHQWNLIDADGKEILNKWYDHFHVRETCGSIYFDVWENEKCNVLDRNQKKLFETWYDSIETRTYDGEVFYAVKQNGLWNVLDSEGQPVLDRWYDQCDIVIEKNRMMIESRNRDGQSYFFDKKGELITNNVSIGYFPSSHDEEVLFATGHVREGFISLSLMDRVHRESALQNRYRQAHKNKLPVPQIIFPLVHASPSLWECFMEDSAYHRILSMMTHHDALQYVENNRHQKVADLQFALELMYHFPRVHKRDAQEYQKRIQHLTEATEINRRELLSHLRGARSTVLTEEVKHYIYDPNPILFGDTLIPRLSSQPKKLADVITHIRLQSHNIGMTEAMQAQAYNNEEDQAQIQHAVFHLHAVHPYIYIRELLQNSLDVQRIEGRIQEEGDNKIEIETFKDSEGDLVLRFQDYGGMTEEEMMGLILPGESSKGAKQRYRGRFGIGFYASMATAPSPDSLRPI